MYLQYTVFLLLIVLLILFCCHCFVIDIIITNEYLDYVINIKLFNSLHIYIYAHDIKRRIVFELYIDLKLWYFYVGTFKIVRVIKQQENFLFYFSGFLI